MKENRQGNKANHKGEDATKYGEFVCSFDHWLPPEEQKRKAEQLEKMTDKKRKNEIS